MAVWLRTLPCVLASVAPSRPTVHMLRELGTGFAYAFAILNPMWFELQQDADQVPSLGSG